MTTLLIVNVPLLMLTVPLEPVKGPIVSLLRALRQPLPDIVTVEVAGSTLPAPAPLPVIALYHCWAIHW